MYDLIEDMAYDRIGKGIYTYSYMLKCVKTNLTPYTVGGDIRKTMISRGFLSSEDLLIKTTRFVVFDSVELSKEESEQAKLMEDTLELKKKIPISATKANIAYLIKLLKTDYKDAHYSLKDTLKTAIENKQNTYKSKQSKLRKEKLDKLFSLTIREAVGLNKTAHNIYVQLVNNCKRDKELIANTFKRNLILSTFGDIKIADCMMDVVLPRINKNFGNILDKEELEKTFTMSDDEFDNLCDSEIFFGKELRFIDSRYSDGRVAKISGVNYDKGKIAIQVKRPIVGGMEKTVYRFDSPFLLRMVG